MSRASAQTMEQVVLAIAIAIVAVAMIIVLAGAVIDRVRRRQSRRHKDVMTAIGGSAASPIRYRRRRGISALRAVLVSERRGSS